MVGPNYSFSALCSLTSFVTNSSKMREIGYHFPPELSVLASLLSSSAEIESLALLGGGEVFNSPELVRAIRSSSVCSLKVKANMSWSSELRLALSESLCPRLQQLSLSEVDFSPEASRAFGSALERCAPHGLRSIRLTGCKVESGKEFVAAFGLAREVESVHFKKVSLGDDDLAKLIERMDKVEELSLHECNIGTRCVAAIAQRACLSTLELCDSPLGGPLLSELASKFRVRGLKRLTLRECTIESTAVARLLERVPRLSSLDLSWNKFDAAAAREIGEAIRDSGCAKTLREFNIACCCLGQAAVTALFAPLSGIMGLTSLMMREDYAEDRGAKMVLECLLPPRIEELSMVYNKITAESAGQLAKFLLKASAISTLDLGGNKLGTEGAVAVIMALISPRRLPMHMLGLSGCEIGDQGAEAVGKLIVSTGCRRVDIEANNIHAAGASAIANSCKKAATEIIILHLDANPIEAEGVKCIAEQIVRANTAVVSLDLMGVYIDDETAKTLARAIRERNREGPIRHLNLFDFTKERNTPLKEARELEHGTKNEVVINL